MVKYEFSSVRCLCLHESQYHLVLPYLSLSLPLSHLLVILLSNPSFRITRRRMSLNLNIQPLLPQSLLLLRRQLTNIERNLWPSKPLMCINKIIQQTPTPNRTVNYNSVIHSLWCRVGSTNWNHGEH